MRQFCEDILKFLKNEYDESYVFSLERCITLNDVDAVKLVIDCGHYKTVLNERVMWYIFGCYRSQEYIGERNQYRWQKELIDIIEGS